jgi:uncharacterized protein YegP (UPF0339 family)
MIFEIYIDKAKQYRFRLRSRNGRILLQSEGYKEKRSIKRLVKSVVYKLQQAILDGRKEYVKVKDLTL